MPRYPKFMLFVMVLIVLVGLQLVSVPMAVSAAPIAAGVVKAPATDIAMGDFVTLVLQYASLAGFAALVAVLVNVGKTFGLVKDGQAGRWAAALNLIGIVTLIALKLYVPAMATTAIDGIAGQAAQIFTVVLGFVIQLYASSTTHDALSTAAIPVVGKSYTVDTQKQAG